MKVTRGGSCGGELLESGGVRQPRVHLHSYDSTVHKMNV